MRGNILILESNMGMLISDIMQLNTSYAREYSGAVLAQALDATFRRRRTALPTTTPVALTPPFHSAPAKQAEWRAYLR